MAVAIVLDGGTKSVCCWIEWDEDVLLPVTGFLATLKERASETFPAAILAKDIV